LRLLKAQQALQMAQEIAASKGQQQVDALHLLRALLSQEESLVVSVLEKLEIDIRDLENKVDSAILKLPRVSVAMGGIAQIFLTQDLGRVLEQAVREAVKLKDEFVSTEHFLLGMLTAPTKVREILNQENIDYDKVLKVLAEVRGGQQVTDPEPETKYQVLEKYARNLTQLAREEKLDPVIGRRSWSRKNSNR